MSLIRVVLPHHLRNLARVGAEVTLDVVEPVTIRSVMEALEAAHPNLRGTVREHGTLNRRPFVRFFACSEDISFQDPEQLLPEAIANGSEPFIVIGAIAGG